jgi:hypothetical protein
VVKLASPDKRGYSSIIREREKMSNLRGHKLLTKELRKQLPPLYFTEKNNVKPLAVVKFFSPYTGWKWYATEFDGEDIFFGLVVGFATELGYFSLKELEEVKVFGNVPAIERDLSFEPTPLEQIREELEKV